MSNIRCKSAKRAARYRIGAAGGKVDSALPPGKFFFLILQAKIISFGLPKFARACGRAKQRRIGINARLKATTVRAFLVSAGSPSAGVTEEAHLLCRDVRNRFLPFQSLASIKTGPWWRPGPLMPNGAHRAASSLAADREAGGLERFQRDPDRQGPIRIGTLARREMPP